MPPVCVCGCVFGCVSGRGGRLLYPIIVIVVACYVMLCYVIAHMDASHINGVELYEDRKVWVIVQQVDDI
jgi:hypothetical protein